GKRQIHSAEKNLPLWTRTQLAASGDPLSRAMMILSDQGARQGLFLRPGTNASGRPQFQSAYVFEAADKRKLWAGITLDEESAPQMWRELEHSGYIEIGPCTAPQAHDPRQAARAQERRFLRNLFGLSQDEWLIFLRCGKQRSSAGMLVIVSNQNL